MKKFLIALLSLAMVFAFAACGSSGSAEEASEETADELHDVLANTVFERTSYETVSETGETEAVEFKYPETLEFANDGTYVYRYWGSDIDETDPELTEEDIENAEMVEKTEDGTYTVDGETLHLSTYEASVDGMSEEEAAAFTPTITLSGDTITIEVEPASLTDEDGNPYSIYGYKTVYTKKEQ